MSYTHFTLEERKYLQQLLSEGYSIRKIAEFLERSPSTISREIKRNKAKNKPHRKTDNKYWYNHWRAQTLYIQRRRQAQYRALKPGTKVWDFIVFGLQNYWSPEAICGRWKLEHPEEKPIHASTIYRYVRACAFPQISAKKNLRRRGKRKVNRSANYNSIQPDRIIPEWPEMIKNRSRIGDWEGDTVYGAARKGLLVTMVDRKSRYLVMKKIPNRTAEITEKVIEEMLRNYPVKSISLDNGAEFSEFHKLEKALKTFVYFAEPHKPWQRGTNENTNGLIRFFYPKGCNFLEKTDEEIAETEFLINMRPKKCLQWRTPFEVFFSICVALA